MAVAEGIHGSISVPTDIFEVELIDDGGAVFPSFTVVELEDKKRDPTSIIFNKKIGISPAYLQSAPNKDTSDLGYLEETVFREIAQSRPAYKFRIKSRKTNKVLDLNVTFRKKKDNFVLDIPEPSEVLFSWKPTFAQLNLTNLTTEETEDPFENVVEKAKIVTNKLISDLQKQSNTKDAEVVIEQDVVVEEQKSESLNTKGANAGAGGIDLSGGAFQKI